MQKHANKNRKFGIAISAICKNRYRSMFLVEEVRMFKRKIYSDLLKWKEESEGTSALLIEGGWTDYWEEHGC